MAFISGKVCENTTAPGGFRIKYSNGFQQFLCLTVREFDLVARALCTLGS